MLCWLTRVWDSSCRAPSTTGNGSRGVLASHRLVAPILQYVPVPVPVLVPGSGSGSGSSFWLLLGWSLEACSMRFASRSHASHAVMALLVW